MAIGWGTIKTVLLFFGPWILPRLLGYYRSLRAVAARQRQQAAASYGHEAVHPLRIRTAVVLGLLATTAAAYLVSGLLGTYLPASSDALFSAGASAAEAPSSPSLSTPWPWSWLAAPENIFIATDSRLQTSTDVLFRRLAALRPGRQLTLADEALRARFASLDSRLLYLQYGPEVLTGCLFCGGTGVDSNDGDSSQSAYAYSLYAAVGLAAQYMTILVLVTLATSPLALLGRPGGGQRGSHPDGHAASDNSNAAARVRRWRLPAVLAVLLIATTDMALLAMYDRRGNVRAARQAELDFFFWSMWRLRGGTLGLVLGALTAVLAFGVTGQTGNGSVLGLLLFGATAGASSPSPAQRIAAVTRSLAGVKGKLNAGAIVKNTTQRDTELRGRTHAYWVREVQLVAQAMEEREVVEGVQDALENRLRMPEIERDADAYAQNVLQPLREVTEAAAEI